MEELKRLEKWSAENFELWLHGGFQELNDKILWRGAFSPLEYYVSSFDNPIDGLTSVYKKLPRRAKRNFRWGIEISLIKISQLCDSFNSFYTTLQLLLYLADKIKCVEILPVIVSWWEDNHELKGEKQKDLFALSLEVASDMAPCPDVVKVIYRIVNSEAFRPSYSRFAPMLFVALCRTNPKQFPAHMKLLRPDFSILHEKPGEIEKSFLTVKRFCKYVSSDIIIEHLQELKLPEDKWLIDGIHKFLEEKK